MLVTVSRVQEYIVAALRGVEVSSVPIHNPPTTEPPPNRFVASLSRVILLRLVVFSAHQCAS